MSIFFLWYLKFFILSAKKTQGYKIVCVFPLSPEVLETPFTGSHLQHWRDELQRNIRFASSLQIQIFFVVISPLKAWGSWAVHLHTELPAWQGRHYSCLQLMLCYNHCVCKMQLTAYFKRYRKVQKGKQKGGQPQRSAWTLFTKRKKNFNKVLKHKIKVLKL